MLTLIALTWADVECSTKHLTEAYNEFINEGNYILHPVNNLITKSIQEFSSIGIYEKVPLFAKNFIDETHPWYIDSDQEPLRVFFAEEKSGKIMKNPKAYTNFRGSSLVFLHCPFEKMNALQKFFLLHELEHVNLDGAMQLSRIYSRPLLMFFNLFFLCFLTSSWWHYIIIFVYAIANVVAYCQSLGKREVIADNGALLKLSNTEEQKEMVDYLIEFSFDSLRNKPASYEWMKDSFSFRPEERKDVIKEIIKIHKLNASLPKENRLDHDNMVWMDRVLHFRWYEYKLKQNKPIPYLGWSSFLDNMLMLPFSLFFLYLGIITTSVPIFPLVVIVIYIMLDILWLQFGYMNKFTEISNKIESQINLKPDQEKS